jgi:hypothetical protein
MPISVTCDGCGKSLKVKDEWAGKRGKCPGCGKTFAIPAAGAAAAGSSRGVAIPKATGKPKKKGSGGISISWGPVIGVLFVVLVVAGIAAYYFGPVKVKAQWEKMGDDADNTVISVVTLAIQSYLSESGSYDPSKAHHTPSASEVMFIFNPMVMSMPDKVPFKGSSTEGPFEGYYHPKTGDLEADVDIGGTSIAGLGAVRKGNTKIKVTGRMVNGHAVAEVGGKKAEIKYRKHDDDN